MQLALGGGRDLPSGLCAPSPNNGRAGALLCRILLPQLDFLSRITAGADIISPSVSSLIMLCYFIAFGVNILGCMWYMIAWYGGSENSWLTTKVCPQTYAGIVLTGSDQVPRSRMQYKPSKHACALCWSTEYNVQGGGAG